MQGAAGETEAGDKRANKQHPPLRLSPIDVMGACDRCDGNHRRQAELKKTKRQIGLDCKGGRIVNRVLGWKSEGTIVC